MSAQSPATSPVPAATYPTQSGPCALEGPGPARITYGTVSRGCRTETSSPMIATNTRQGSEAGQPKSLPVIIQGGMGVAVSSWQLAGAVSRTGQLGVVSGTALDVVVARRLQDGDPEGHVRRALDHFPVPAMADRIVQRYFRSGGRPVGRPYKATPQLTLRPGRHSQELSVVANFVEVWLAKEGHDGHIGINFLEKIQLGTAAAAYGAMLADVDYVLMGAGIPAKIPHLLDELADHERAQLDLHVDGATSSYTVDLDPQSLTGMKLPPLRRPTFLAIVSADVLATYLAREDGTRPDGFVIEGPPAGGHNAPPRGRLTLDDTGQPIFGPRDDANVSKVAALGLPFWLAGSYATPQRLREAKAMGAVGIQAGTIFALSSESGITPDLRREMLVELAEGQLHIRTDALASPTRFPFKVASVSGTLASADAYEARPRVCDLGFLRAPYERSAGTIGYRCPSEPVDDYVRKGGAIADTMGRMCLCNGLTATIGLGQSRQNGYQEVPLATLGADLTGAKQLLDRHPDGWSAGEAVDYLVSGSDH
jgi:NAD(P)H-dependent flavin oxidoreductase YrpB (nitropropane dioxygenase family)